MSAAARHLDITALPGPKEERWKYTPIARAVPAGLTPAYKDDVQAVIIHKGRGESAGKPVDILWKSQSGAQLQPRLEITLEEGAEATVIERHAPESGAYWKNMVTVIKLGPNARLNHIRIQDDGLEAIQTNMVDISLERDAVYDGFSLNMGGKLTRHEIHAVLNGPNAEVSFNGLNLFGGGQHGYTTILIEHKAPHCRSNQFYRTLLNDTARGVFQGKIHVHRIAQKTDGYQLANTILLSDGAEMDTKPELEIYADDVKCSHGTTCGQLDEAPLFYLRTRGLSEAEARLLLVQAFVDEVVDKIADDDIRAGIQEKALSWLHTALGK